MRLSEMKNLGVVTEENLNEVGIETPEQLRQLGAKGAFLQVRDLVDEGACLHFLYGLEGAIQDIPKKELPIACRQSLKDFYHTL